MINMRKAVLISIRPRWCEKIASGEKTIEFRKNRPQQRQPFKCYIYCTYGFREPDVTKSFAEKCCGKVIGEFVCNGFVPFNGNKKWPTYSETRAQAEAATPGILKKACLTPKELREYQPKGNPIGWCISDLAIYDSPKDLSEFAGIRTGKDGFELRVLDRPPQSWCYVAERASNNK